MVVDTVFTLVPEGSQSGDSMRSVDDAVSSSPFTVSEPGPPVLISTASVAVIVSVPGVSVLTMRLPEPTSSAGWSTTRDVDQAVAFSIRSV
jgi:hypothetical protein